MPILKISDIKKSYGKTVVLKDIDLEIEENTIFGLLGPNGAGKSTLAKIIVGSLAADKGHIELFGKPFSRDSFEQRRLLGIVPQEPSFYRGFTVEQNLNFFGKVYNLNSKELKKQVEFLLGWLNLESSKQKKAMHLSGGYQRLLNIAISLIHSPKIILLDEPTVGLDPSNRHMFWDKILDLKKAGLTIILTTHYMDEAQSLSDEIAFIKDGKILLKGNPDNLIADFGGVGYFDILLPKKPSSQFVNRLRETLPNTKVGVTGNKIMVIVQTKNVLRYVSIINEIFRLHDLKPRKFIYKEPDLEDVFISLIEHKGAFV